MANQNKVGLVFGALFGGFHLLWALLVLSGYAQALYDFILWAHMIHVPIIIGPFDATAAITLVIVTAIIGYIVGNIGASVWNRVHRS
ncbi:hypothetical protein HY090_00165 [Candidatus Kaiserbacteria bacterium]|nr:hypothetical protein [Candidatus Kaiserbacteria bacterium]